MTTWGFGYKVKKICYVCSCNVISDNNNNNNTRSVDIILWKLTKRVVGRVNIIYSVRAREAKTPRNRCAEWQLRGKGVSTHPLFVSLLAVRFGNETRTLSRRLAAQPVRCAFTPFAWLLGGVRTLWVHFKIRTRNER